MFKVSRLAILISAGLMLCLAGCSSKNTPVSKGGYYYSGIYFGKNLVSAYKKGIKDGCRSAKGNYSKNHYLFNSNKEYNNGWFLGRNRCNDLITITEK